MLCWGVNQLHARIRVRDYVALLFSMKVSRSDLRYLTAFPIRKYGIVNLLVDTQLASVEAETPRYLAASLRVSKVALGI